MSSFYMHGCPFSQKYKETQRETHKKLLHVFILYMYQPWTPFNLCWKKMKYKVHLKTNKRVPFPTKDWYLIVACWTFVFFFPFLLHLYRFCNWATNNWFFAPLLCHYVVIHIKFKLWKEQKRANRVQAKLILTRRFARVRPKVFDIVAVSN